MTDRPPGRQEGEGSGRGGKPTIGEVAAWLRRTAEERDQTEAAAASDAAPAPSDAPPGVPSPEGQPPEGPRSDTVTDGAGSDLPTSAGPTSEAGALHEEVPAAPGSNGSTLPAAAGTPPSGTGGSEVPSGGVTSVDPTPDAAGPTVVAAAKGDSSAGPASDVAASDAAASPATPPAGPASQQPARIGGAVPDDVATDEPAEATVPDRPDGGAANGGPAVAAEGAASAPSATPDPGQASSDDRPAGTTAAGAPGDLPGGPPAATSSITGSSVLDERTAAPEVLPAAAPADTGRHEPDEPGAPLPQGPLLAEPPPHPGEPAGDTPAPAEELPPTSGLGAAPGLDADADADAGAGAVARSSVDTPLTAGGAGQDDRPAVADLDDQPPGGGTGTATALAGGDAGPDPDRPVAARPVAGLADAPPSPAEATPPAPPAPPRARFDLDLAQVADRARASARRGPTAPPVGGDTLERQGPEVRNGGRPDDPDGSTITVRVRQSPQARVERRSAPAPGAPEADWEVDAEPTGEVVVASVPPAAAATKKPPVRKPSRPKRATYPRGQLKERIGILRRIRAMLGVVVVTVLLGVAAGAAIGAFLLFLAFAVRSAITAG